MPAKSFDDRFMVEFPHEFEGQQKLREPTGPVLHADDEVRVRGDSLGKIYWQGRQWAVTAHGIECRDGTYVVGLERLRKIRGNNQIDWLWHVAEHEWVDLEDFRTAFLVACAFSGIHIRPTKFIDGNWD